MAAPPAPPAPNAPGLAGAPASGGTEPPREEAGEACPLCGTPLNREQEWCLRCGAAARTRLAATPNWRLPIAAIVAVVALALGVLAAALVDLAGRSNKTTVKVTRIVTAPAAAGVPTVSTPATTTPAPGATAPLGTTPGATAPATTAPATPVPRGTTPGTSVPTKTAPRATTPTGGGTAAPR